jgi:hypothetical protein
MLKLVGVILALLVVAAPVGAEALQAGKVYRIGILAPAEPAPRASPSAFRNREQSPLAPCLDPRFCIRLETEHQEGEQCYVRGSAIC